MCTKGSKAERHESPSVTRQSTRSKRPSNGASTHVAPGDLLSVLRATSRTSDYQSNCRRSFRVRPSLSLLYRCVRTAARLERAVPAHLLDELPFHPRPHQLCWPVVGQATRRLRLRNEDPRAVLSDTVVSKREVRQYHWVQGVEDAIKKTTSRGSVVLMSMHCQHALSLLLSLYCYC